MAVALTVTEIWFYVKSSRVLTQCNAVKCSLSEHCSGGAALVECITLNNNYNNSAEYEY